MKPLEWYGLWFATMLFVLMRGSPVRFLGSSKYAAHLYHITFLMTMLPIPVSKLLSGPANTAVFSLCVLWHLICGYYFFFTPCITYFPVSVPEEAKPKESGDEE